MKAKQDLDQEYLKELFDYDAEEGCLYWKERSIDHFVSPEQQCFVNKRWAGKKAGTSIGKYPYSIVRIKGIKYRSHRVIWVWHYGAISNGLIMDHINGKKKDNRIENLQLCTPSDNNRKRELRKDNTSGVTGVCFDILRGTWVVRLKIRNKNKHIGYFVNKKDAIVARLAAEKEYYGSFAPSNHEYITKEYEGCLIET